MARSRFVSKSMIEEHQRRATDESLAPARALLKHLNVEARTYAAIGEPAATIVAFAKKQRCIGIVMGSRGQGQPRGADARLGGCQGHRSATCPVTTVK